MTYKTILTYIKYKNGIGAQYEFDFTSLTMPLVKNMNYGLISSQMISVQPMSAPTNQVFYMDFKYRNKWTDFYELVVKIREQSWAY